MAFKKFSYKKIEYDTLNDSCLVTVAVKDDALGDSEHTFVLGAKHFKGKAFSAVARNNQIKVLVRAEVKEIHGRLAAKAAKQPESKTSIPLFADVNNLE